jgi:hypothetical protein
MELGLHCLQPWLYNESGLESARRLTGAGEIA